MLAADAADRAESRLADGDLTARQYSLALALTVLVALVLRCGLPLADPPWHATVGIVWHDEGAWLHNARNMALFGEWRLDQWNPMFLAPVFTALEYASFRLFGVGLWQARIVSELLGTVSVLCLAGAVRQTSNRRAGLVAGMLLATNYVWVMWNRAALLETAMVSFRVLSASAYVRAHRGQAWPRGLAAGAFSVPAFFTKAVPATRYLNPVLPFAAISAGVAVAASARAAGRLRPVAALAIGLAAAAPGCQQSLNADWFFRQEDTRTLALRYIHANVQPGAGIAVQPYSVPLTQSRESLLEALRVNLGDPGKASPKFALRLRLDPYPEPAYRTTFIGDGGLDADKIYVGYRELGGPHGLAALRKSGVSWVVLKRYAEPGRETVPFLTALEAEGRLLASFSPYRQERSYGGNDLPAPYLHNMDSRITRELERPGPVVEVWQLSGVQK